VANIKSQIKRIKTNDKRRLRNKAAKSEIKTRVKLALRAAETGDERAGDYLRLAVKKLDKAAARGIIHSNQAANRKSALMHKAALLQAAPGSSTLEEQEAESAAVTPETTAPQARGRDRGRAERAERQALRARMPRRGRRAKGQEMPDEAGELEAGEDAPGQLASAAGEESAAPAGAEEVESDK
jgi:small subunit ribosomal protein S20